MTTASRASVAPTARVMPHESNARMVGRAATKTRTWLQEGSWWPVLLSSFLFAAWTSLLGVMQLVLPSDEAFIDRTLAATSLLVALAALQLASHLLRVPAPWLATTVLNGLLMNIAFVVHALGASRPWTWAETAHIVTLYVALLLTFVLGAIAHKCRSNTVALSAEVKELRTTNLNLMAMLSSKGSGAEDPDDESEVEGDDREHLIMPPAPCYLPDETIGKPEVTPRCPSAAWLPVAASGYQWLPVAASGYQWLRLLLTLSCLASRC